MKARNYRLTLTGEGIKQISLSSKLAEWHSFLGMLCLSAVPFYLGFPHVHCPKAMSFYK